MENVSGLQLILGLVIGVGVLVWLILATKVHVFLALILSAALTGLIAGLDPAQIATTIANGFGSTLGGIGAVIGFGVMMGKLLEVSGAAERMALSFLRLFGKGREDWAMASTGYVVSIPIFCDSGFVILSPLAKALARRTGRSVVALGVALAAGLVVTHHAVPPTPGPLAVAGLFGVDLGLMILYGALLSIPPLVAVVFYARRLAKQVTPDDLVAAGQTAAESGSDEVAAAREERELPSATAAFAPIVLPVILIFANTLVTALKPAGAWVGYVTFLGNPIVAVGLGLLVAIYGLMRETPREKVVGWMEQGISSAGIILLVTGGGGALGAVLRASGIGDYLAGQIAATALPAVLLPFAVASIVRLVQGSGTVAMITAASITAPVLAGTGANMALAAVAATQGAMVFSYFNDSYFWVVNRLLGITQVKKQVQTWSVPSTLAWAASLVVLLVVSLFA
ncbi:GntP family permease [Limnochorda pilosa]|uniref:Gluconate permease n=1 Tax=Limnochorda pilosa TaxID=1555112 RepID=A0A0K2SLQ4_LIMPI|nr:gluconate:H+ symporter [Limnochorda pilosa]BAS27749.1 gluconate permease [Limnochorda pilosa]